MPESLALLDRLRAAGHAAVVSGAGPSLLVLAQRRPEEPAGNPVAAAAVAALAALAPEGWRVLPLSVDFEGARVRPANAEVSLS
jgi:homoserine kinase